MLIVLTFVIDVIVLALAAKLCIDRSTWWCLIPVLILFALQTGRDQEVLDQESHAQKS